MQAWHKTCGNLQLSVDENMNLGLLNPFSKRHEEGTRAGRVKPSLPQRLRRRIWQTLVEFDYTYYHRPNPNDNWNEETSVLEQLPSRLRKLYGVEELEAFVGQDNRRASVDLKGFVLGAYPTQVFDVIEMFYDGIKKRRSEFQAGVNQTMQHERCPWLLCDGYLFEINSAFLQEHIMQRTHELLAAAPFDGALDEFMDARNDLAARDYKGAIHNAAKAFESTLKAIENVDAGNAKVLIDGLKQTAFYDQFPEPLASGLGDQVLMSLPYIRNRLGGHGQGSLVVTVPRSVAELAVHLAGTFIVFLVSRHLEVSRETEPMEQRGESMPTASDIPF